VDSWEYNDSGFYPAIKNQYVELLDGGTGVNGANSGGSVADVLVALGSSIFMNFIARLGWVQYLRYGEGLITGANIVVANSLGWRYGGDAYTHSYPNASQVSGGGGPGGESRANSVGGVIPGHGINSGNVATGQCSGGQGGKGGLDTSGGHGGDGGITFWY